MPITFHYDEKENVLYETGIGELSSQDFMEYRERLRHAGLKRNFRCLSDYSQAHLNFSPGQMKEYAESFYGITKKYGKIKVAINVATNLEYGMARMFELFNGNEDYHIEVFTEKKVAEDWLFSD